MVSDWSTSAVAMELALHELLQLSDAWMSVGVVLCTTLLLFVLYTHHKVNQRDKSSAGVLPPGSVGWPLLGETIPFARNPVKYSTAHHSIQHSPSMYTYTHALLVLVLHGSRFTKDRIVKYGSVFRTHLLFKPTVVVADPAHVRTVLAFSAEASIIQPMTTGPTR